MDRLQSQPVEQNQPAEKDNKQASKATMQAHIASRSSNRNKAQDAFRTIREVADELDLQQHVLRFWETKFSQIKPMKRGGGRRYYRPDDVILLKNIRYLLHTEGYTIKGVQKLLKEEGKKALSQDLLEEKPQQPVAATSVAAQENDLVILLQQLKDLRDYIGNL